jgi:hypothetical protein
MHFTDHERCIIAILTTPGRNGAPSRPSILRAALPEPPAAGSAVKTAPSSLPNLVNRCTAPTAPASQGPQSLTSLLTVAQLRAVPATAVEVGPPALANTRRSSLRGYPSGVCK